MPDYSKTVIYKIQHQDNGELLYVGSTTHFIERKSRHKSRCHNPNTKENNLKLYQMIRQNGGWECFRMVQLKDFPCENKRQAEAEEDKIMLELKANMNSNRASRTDKQYCLDNKDKRREYNKQYRVYNVDKIKEQKREYYTKNIDKFKEYKKEYTLKNAEKIKESNKEYRLQNAEKIKEKIVCVCGCEVSRIHLARHKKSTKHQGRMLLQQTI